MAVTILGLFFFLFFFFSWEVHVCGSGGLIEVACGEQAVPFVFCSAFRVLVFFLASGGWKRQGCFESLHASSASSWAGRKPEAATVSWPEPLVGASNRSLIHARHWPVLPSHKYILVHDWSTILPVRAPPPLSADLRCAMPFATRIFSGFHTADGGFSHWSLPRRICWARSGGERIPSAEVYPYPLVLNAL